MGSGREFGAARGTANAMSPACPARRWALTASGGHGAGGAAGRRGGIEDGGAGAEGALQPV